MRYSHPSGQRQTSVMESSPPGLIIPLSLCSQLQDRNALRGKCIWPNLGHSAGIPEVTISFSWLQRWWVHMWVRPLQASVFSQIKHWRWEDGFDCQIPSLVICMNNFDKALTDVLKTFSLETEKGLWNFLKSILTLSSNLTHTHALTSPLCLLDVPGLDISPEHFWSYLPNALLAVSLIWIWMMAWDREESELTPVAPVLRSFPPFKITCKIRGTKYKKIVNKNRISQKEILSS